MSMTSAADAVLRAIGETPAVRLRRVVSPGSAEVLVKLQSVNPTGSYQDRMALAMIEGTKAIQQRTDTLQVGVWTQTLKAGALSDHRSRKSLSRKCPT